MTLYSKTQRWLSDHFGNKVPFDEPMADHPSLRVGGTAEAYVVPQRLEDLVNLINSCRRRDLRYMVIGDGTNLLIDDRGVKGIVIDLKKCLTEISKADVQKETSLITAMAGARIQTFCSFAIKHGFEGVNFALGIPGTIGGGIIMNAGTSYGSFDEVLESIKILLSNGEIDIVHRRELDFSYRNLSWERLGKIKGGHRYDPILLEGRFRLRHSSPAKLKREAKEIMQKRKENQPSGFPSAGCFFKNPASGQSAGELIDLAGLKGEKRGGAEISSKHANFFVNCGGASAADFLSLIEMVKKAVSKKFKIDLETEVKYIG